MNESATHSSLAREFTVHREKVHHIYGWSRLLDRTLQAIEGIA